MRCYEFYDKVTRKAVYVVDEHYIRVFAQEQKAPMDRFEPRGAVNILVSRGEYYTPDKKRLLTQYNENKYNNFILV